MIIGDGDIASVLPDRDDFVFFASGVSNSREDRESEFQREKDLLFDTYSEHCVLNIKNGVTSPPRKLVYFGSLSVLYADTPYAKHKREMEEHVKSLESWAIVRIGNITWGNNPHTIINSMRAQKERGEELDIQDAFRYVVDKDEFLYWVNLIPDFNMEMNIPGKRMTIKELVDTYVNT